VVWLLILANFGANPLEAKKKLMGNLGEVFNFSLSIKNDHQDRDDDGSIHASDAIVVARCVLDIIIIIITVLFFFLLTSLSLVAVKEKNEEKKRKQQLRER
jgi:hypothetical protein|tara:strand:- start:45 stop:347 length:303 start_codon:yes stop_codon:yes gene_type:complete